MKLTGKDLYAAYIQGWPYYDLLEPTPWDELGGKACYEAIAARLNETHIAPMLGLVREYQLLTLHVSEELDPEWFALRDEADKCAFLLMGEEEAKG